MKTKEKKSNQHFWVTNFSNRNVSLSDLALTIPAYRTVNLMDTKHYQYTLPQLQKSAESGSLYLKRDKIHVRKERPDVNESKSINLMSTTLTPQINREEIIPSRERSTFIIKEEKYDELNISDEEFAIENAETAELDTHLQMVKKDINSSE